jgi:hypothetical protein
MIPRTASLFITIDPRNADATHLFKQSHAPLTHGKRYDASFPTASWATAAKRYSGKPLFAGIVGKYTGTHHADLTVVAREEQQLRSPDKPFSIHRQ